ncbi:L-ribulose-5-phosphate 4-epimerase [Deinococcus marmoris]|uniref:L-ribulose-5-phosphate 4-epimerase n=1 Tax=Deinococcus marmoris TaxID=249408 RepID=UPI0004968012|nr:L-ribulose-5-phosphate 4-epimerase [Deinococcus marmoris]
MNHAELRAELHALHLELPKNSLVTWTSGNISARVDGGLLIKPSGVTFAELTPESMVATDLDAQVIEGDLSPSSDTATHAYIYRHLPDVGGIVHTHSPYATAWAATGHAIPCVLTAMADEFGGPVPCGSFAPIGGADIGQEVVRVLKGHRSPAIILQSHGVFTIGKTPLAALKAAVMVEDVARTVFLACQLAAARGVEVQTLAPADIDRLHHRYTHVYGQHQETP